MGSEGAPGKPSGAPARPASRGNLWPYMRNRFAVASITVVLVALVPTSAVAEEHGDGSDEPAVVVDDGGAAVPVPPAEVEAEDLPWTSRFLPPTLVLLTVLTIVGLAAYYVVGIRRKYEVVAK